MKKLVLGFALVIGMIGNAQQYRGMRQAEFNFLKKYNISYMSPWGRSVINDVSNFESFTTTDKRTLKKAYDKFLIWNNKFSNNPINSNVILEQQDFYFKELDPNPYQITGLVRINIDRDDIEYIEIVEYTVFRGGVKDYESIILVKYIYHPVEHYWNDTFYEECGQCPTLN